MKIGCVVLAYLFGSISAFVHTSYSTQTRPSSSLYAQRQKDGAFAAFADSLEEEPEESWQQRLESLLDPTTSLAQRQILMSELLSANQEIRDSVTEALRDRKVKTEHLRFCL